MFSPRTFEVPRRIYLFVPGINTFPGLSKNWNGKAATHFICYNQYFAEKVEYFVTALTRPIGQNYRAGKLVATLQRYIEAGWEIVLCGHSNGSDVILDALRSLDWPRIEELHLISPACEADFDKNGLNVALRANRIGLVKVFIAGRDLPLRLAGTKFGRALGFGTLGSNAGAEAVDPTIAGKVQTVREPGFGHSTWFRKENFTATMNKVAFPGI